MQLDKFLKLEAKAHKNLDPDKEIEEQLETEGVDL